MKARVLEPTVMEEKIRSLLAVFIGEDHQTDHYFDIEKGKLKLREGTIENLITHYERINASGIEKTQVYRYDVNPIEAEVSALFERHVKIGEVKKRRKIFWLNNVKIHLDTLASGETFIEIEAIDTGNISAKSCSPGNVRRSGISLK